MYNHIVCAKASKYFSSAVCMLVSVCAFLFWQFWSIVMTDTVWVLILSVTSDRYCMPTFKSIFKKVNGDESIWSWKVGLISAQLNYTSLSVLLPPHTFVKLPSCLSHYLFQIRSSTTRWWTWAGGVTTCWFWLAAPAPSPSHPLGHCATCWGNPVNGSSPRLESPQLTMGASSAWR